MRWRVCNKCKDFQKFGITRINPNICEVCGKNIKQENEKEE